MGELRAVSPSSAIGFALNLCPSVESITGAWMDITKVRLHDLKSEVVNRRHSAVVLLENEAGQISLKTSVTTEEGVDAMALAEALLADAIRQLTRLPEYRTGKTSITVARDALDGAVEGA